VETNRTVRAAANVLVVKNVNVDLNANVLSMKNIMAKRESRKSTTRKNIPSKGLTMNNFTPKFDMLTTALSAANAAAIVWSFCALLVAFMPELAAKLMAHTTHLAGEQFAPVTVQGFLGGFVTVWLYAFVLGGLFAFFYNKARR